MGIRYYSPLTIAREQSRMRRRAHRAHLSGRCVALPGETGLVRAFLHGGENKYPGYLIVEVHGGGFMYNTACDDDDFCAFIHRRLGIPVLSCDYRLAPRHAYPAGLEDVYACARAAVSLDEVKADPRKLILWGHSAGANLAAGAAFLAKQRGGFSPALLILDYPYMDAFRTGATREPIPGSVPSKLMDTFAHYYTGPERLREPLVSPALTPAADLTDMPETCLLLCGRDNLREGGLRYGELLCKAGVPVTIRTVDDGLHGFIENHFNYNYIPLATRLQMTDRQRALARESTEWLCRWILKRIGKQGGESLDR